MADKKISELTAATTPLAGTEVLPIVQSSTTKKVATDDLTVKNVRSNATTGILQIAGPAAGATRVATVPDANFTAARTDAEQTFTGNQTIIGDVVFRRSADSTGVKFSYGGDNNPIFEFNMTDGSPRYRFNMNSDTDIKFETNVGGGFGTAWQVDRVSRDLKTGAGDFVIATANKVIKFEGNNNIIWRTGAGSPEGVVTAPIGSLYTRSDGGANTTLYIKESGAGNTGWVAK